VSSAKTATKVSVRPEREGRVYHPRTRLVSMQEAHKMEPPRRLEHVNRLVLDKAIALANGDFRRIVPQDDGSVLVVNR
jgi:hypothetical protein